MRCPAAINWLGFPVLVGVLVFLMTWPCFAATKTVLDQFDNASYGNQDGTDSWTTNWVEESDEGTPYAGIFNIYNGKLHLNALAWIFSGSGQITRGVDLSEATNAVLSFDYADFATSFLHGRVETKIMVSPDGGSTWHDFGSINSGNTQGSRSIDISAYMGADTRIRFYLFWADLWAFESMVIDNVQVQYQVDEAPRLVAHYALEGDVTDSSGNGHDGGRRGTVEYRQAKVCDGVQLDGGGYLQVPDNNDFDLANAFTVMAWIHPDSLSVPGHTEGLYSFLSKDTNYEFHVRSNGGLYWWWNGGSLNTGTGLVPVGDWTHVAFVYSRSAGSLQVFVNGSQVANQSYSSPMPVNNAPFYIGTDKTTGGGEMPQRRFYGSIDEVRVYSGALSGGEIGGLMNETNPCGAAIDHYEIVHDGSALTCSPEAVTIRACVDADCTSLYTEDVDIDLSPSGWVGGNSQVLSGGSGVFRLRHTTLGTVSLSVGSQDPAADSGPQCMDGGGGSSCDLTFHGAGFLFDVPDLTSCAVAENILIAAVRADATGEQCVGDDSFADTTRNVNFWYSYQQPAAGTRALQVNGGAVAGTSPGTGVQLSFDSQAQSLLDVRYADAGRVGLSARFEGSGEEAGLIMVGSDSFVVAPHHLLVTATADGTPLNNTTPGGDPHWPAGEDFTLQVAGVCSDDSVTPNFAAATGLSATAPFQPATGTLGALTGGPFAESDFSGGEATDTAAYGEVGIITLQAEVADYLGSGIDVSGSTVVGRFTPYRFDVSLNNPDFASACGSGGFTYVGQPFLYATDPVITLTARNKSGGTTENYTGFWWKITSATLAGKAYSAASGTLDLSNIPATDPVITDLGGGMGLLTFGDGGGLRFARNASPVTPFDAEISLAIDVLDGDGIAAANPVTFGAASAGNGIVFDAGKEMRWGRLVLQNAYGSELLDLAMPLRTEYFDSGSFVFNGDDSCTGLLLSQLRLSNASGTTVTADSPIAVGSGSSSASLLSPLLAGDANLSFSHPDDEGFIDVSVNLSSLDWLRYDWDGDNSHDDDPQGRATFGIYKGRPNLIYLRETYR